MAKKEEQLVDESKNPKGEKVVYSDRVDIKATKGAKHLTPGKEYSLHPVAAKKLVDKGFAEYVK